METARAGGGPIMPEEVVYGEVSRHKQGPDKVVADTHLAAPGPLAPGGSARAR